METQKTQKSHRSIFKNIAEMENAVGKELIKNESILLLKLLKMSNGFILMKNGAQKNLHISKP